jgi:hypothetical protein
MHLNCTCPDCILFYKQAINFISLGEIGHICTTLKVELGNRDKKKNCLMPKNGTLAFWAGTARNLTTNLTNIKYTSFDGWVCTGGRMTSNGKLAVSIDRQSQSKACQSLS